MASNSEYEQRQLFFEQNKTVKCYIKENNLTAKKLITEGLAGSRASEKWGINLKTNK